MKKNIKKEQYTARKKDNNDDNNVDDAIANVPVAAAASIDCREICQTTQ